jgi:murein tripeptide amidase MpaA
MVDVRFDRYYRYDDLTAIIHAFAEEYPGLVSVESIGKSYEGRDIWVASVTNFDTGPAEEKPAVWVDGNIHAGEVSPSSTCLHLLNRLTTEYGENEKITFLLDSRTYYICPRISVDGAEWALADKPKRVRSSTRPYPYDEDPIDGLVTEDMDGDGRILSMRIEDPNGQWKPYPGDPRLLIRREPDDYGGTYYRVLPEGRIDNYDGMTIQLQPNKEGLDNNRNFPNNWRQNNEQQGAGPYPTSEPEVRAVADFLIKHNNINTTTSFHTYSGVLLRPYANKADAEMPGEDLWVYEKMGKKGTEITGYPNISIFHEFKYHPQQVITGGQDWMYEHLGMFWWAVEIWSPQQQAGIEEYKFIDWYREHDLEDDLKLLKWSDEVLEGKGYISWYEYDHPQLGKVELGGWDMFYAWWNPPPQFLEKEIEPFADWFIWQGLMTAKLELFDVDVAPLDGDTYRIRLGLHNTGWLPTNTTKVALAKQTVRGVICEIELPEGATLETGKVREILGQLEGRSNTGASMSPFTLASSANTNDRLKIEWVVKAPKGSVVKLIARQDRAGVVRKEVTLE